MSRKCDDRSTGGGGRARGYDRAVRFPVVLFDLDGTVIDSGAIILASLRHAAKEVLGTAPPDGELMAAVGGPGLEAQMHAFARAGITIRSPPTAGRPARVWRT